jgi:hypothetical protein
MVGRGGGGEAQGVADPPKLAFRGQWVGLQNWPQLRNVPAVAFQAGRALRRTTAAAHGQLSAADQARVPAALAQLRVHAGDAGGFVSLANGSDLTYDVRMAKSG